MYIIFICYQNLLYKPSEITKCATVGHPAPHYRSIMNFDISAARQFLLSPITDRVIYISRRDFTTSREFLSSRNATSSSTCWRL